VSLPDAAALVFACLGVALALHGRRAIRARMLNLASVATSVFMNAIAAGLAEPGHLGDAPIAYALASDTSDRRRPRLGHRPPPAPWHHARQRHGHAAGHPWRPDLVAAAARPSALARSR